MPDRQVMYPRSHTAHISRQKKHGNSQLFFSVLRALASCGVDFFAPLEFPCELNGPPKDGSAHHPRDGFTLLQDLVLAKAWAVATREGIDQNANTLWLRVCEILNESLLVCNPEDINETTTAVRTRFRIIQRTTNKYLTARKPLVSSLGSGTGPEEEEVR